MSSASFRVTLWLSKKSLQARICHVSVASRDEAVSVAQQWVCWSNDKDRKKRTKFDRYRVEESNTGDGWTIVAEGTLEDAKAQPQSEEEVDAVGGGKTRRLIGDQGTTARFRPVVRKKAKRPETRLAKLVAEVLARK